MSNTITKELLEYINRSTAPYQVVAESEKILAEAGFEALPVTKRWNLEKGKSYYVIPYPTTLLAFTIGEDWEPTHPFRIGAAHTDHPGFRVKPNAEMTQGKYLKLNTEVYGGPILNTWMDRPLSLAGRVALRSDDVFHPTMKLIDIKKPILTIPNLAIHINREVNKGVELNRQTDTLPLVGMIKEALDGKEGDDKFFFLNFLAEKLGVNKEDILDYDMYIYNAEEGSTIGLNEEFISSPRLDNLTSCYALLKGIIEGRRTRGVNVIALYDNEEIGSKTKQGADSALLPMIIDKIYTGLGVNPVEYKNEAMLDSILLSVDVAHGVHPNRPEKYDPINQAFLNKGVVFKIDSNQKYTYDTEAIGILQQVCEKSDAAYQKFVNRSDAPGGSTLGSILSSWLPMKTVDLGVPLLAMHSSREMMGAKDQEHLNHLVKGFFHLF